MFVQIGGRLKRAQNGKLVACLGIDVQAALPAPGDELGWLDIDAGCAPAESMLFLLGLLRAHSPEAVRAGQLVPVFHDCQRIGVVFEAIPHHACNGC